MKNYGLKRDIIKTMNKIPIVLVIVTLSLCLIHCGESVESGETLGSISGTVQSGGMTGVLPVHPAYLFLNDSLAATTDRQGRFSISSVEEGARNLTCSALEYSDAEAQIYVLGGMRSTYNFFLIPDTTKAKLYGEFQDLVLFGEAVASDPSLLQWDVRQIFDGFTGATIQSKTLRYEVPNRYVYLGDSLLAVSDGFGQFWTEVQCGTYCLTGRCQGYREASQVVKIVPGRKNYLCFFLDREPALSAW